MPKVKNVTKDTKAKKAPAPVSEIVIFVQRSCRKVKEGYRFTGIMADGFNVTVTHQSKSEAVFDAESVGLTVLDHATYLRQAANAKRKAARALKKSAA